MEPINFKINYPRCTKGSLHDNQALNNICLDKNCSSKFLICTICKTEQHATHNVKPLKFYLQQLRTKYSGTKQLKVQLDELENARNQYLLTIQEIVQQIAIKFQDLQREICDRFQLLKNDILYENSLRNQFSDVVHLISRRQYQSDFQNLISQFLPQNNTHSIPTTQKLIQTSTDIKHLLDLVITHYKSDISRQPILKNIVDLNIKSNILHGEGIKITASQIQHSGLIYSLCLIDNKISTEDHKIKFKILSDCAKATFGIMNMTEFKSSNYIFNPNKQNQNSYWLAHDGKKANSNYSCLTGFAKNDVVDVSYKKGQMVINKKKTKNYATFVIKDIGTDWYFFFALEGDTRIQLVNKVKK